TPSPAPTTEPSSPSAGPGEDPDVRLPEGMPAIVDAADDLALIARRDLPPPGGGEGEPLDAPGPDRADGPHLVRRQPPPSAERAHRVATIRGRGLARRVRLHGPGAPRGVRDPRRRRRVAR